MSEKPLVFLSHATNDKSRALNFKKILEEGFKEDLEMEVEIFVSSAADAIKIGRDWQNTILEKLDAAQALIVFITPHSVNRPWIWFEIGYFWKKWKDNQKLHIYPLYAQGQEIPSPLNVLQGKMLDDEDDIKNFAEQLIIQLTANDNDLDANQRDRI